MLVVKSYFSLWFLFTQIEVCGSSQLLVTMLSSRMLITFVAKEIFRLRVRYYPYFHVSRVSSIILLLDFNHGDGSCFRWL